MADLQECVEKILKCAALSEPYRTLVARRVNDLRPYIIEITQNYTEEFRCAGAISRSLELNRLIRAYLLA